MSWWFWHDFFKKMNCCFTRSIIFRNSQRSWDLLRFNRMTSSIYFLLCSINWITAEQKNNSVTQKFYNQTDKKKLFEENINSQCQQAWEKNIQVHSKDFWWFQLFSSSESQSTVLCWLECVKATWIWCHDLSHAK